MRFHHGSDYRSHYLPLAARRCYRLAFATTLSLALCYGLDIGIPFVAPVFAVLVASAPAPPPDGPAALGLVLFMAAALTIGILIGPLLQQAPFTALLIIAAGTYFSHRLAISGGKPLPGTLLALGFTVIPAADVASSALASALVEALVLGLAIAIFSLWMVYPFFPEDTAPARPEKSDTVSDDHWLCLRATLVVLPAFAFTLTNPTTNLPFLVKSILLGREASDLQLRHAGRELVGSTLAGGLLAITVWWCLGFAVELWFFSAWILLVSLFVAAGCYQVFRNRFSPGFWSNALMNMLILLGAAVQDSAAGKDVYQAFMVRMSLFLLVAVYALVTMQLLEWWRRRRRQARNCRRSQ
ncbi:DUF2955 domain-containing protein [Microbulbifer elongatus]|uniref:DUF2955 domain-containing protein n=1 Tax=Microbulbifer elongatus TaxID=86173 RepID=A0ABT1NY67_9GAMM|nr:DUF2955 domain-containing protein [Microbulbifer elongatus]MCQ3828825.1 DUF2955 domain-containing protein [Microbulbifer elongatus]